MKAEHLQIHVTSHLELKRGVYQMILNWHDASGKRCRKSITTGMIRKGNKKRAETMLSEKRKEWEDMLNTEPYTSGSPMELYADYLEHWLETVKGDLKPTTFGNHQTTITRIIAPYFRDKGITLQNLTADDILTFYSIQLEHVKATTVHKYHTIFSRSLKCAVEKELIEHSPMEKVKRPKAERFVGKFLKESEVKELFEAVKGHKLELGVILGAYYGLRRAEIVGLQWLLYYSQN